MRGVSLDPEAILARLELASSLADLRPEHRLDAKLDMSPAGVTRRLQLASELSELCTALGEAGRQALAEASSKACEGVAIRAERPRSP
jgi:hypothetical protein